MTIEEMRAVKAAQDAIIAAQKAICDLGRFQPQRQRWMKHLADTQLAQVLSVLWTWEDGVYGAASSFNYGRHFFPRHAKKAMTVEEIKRDEIGRRLVDGEPSR